MRLCFVGRPNSGVSWEPRPFSGRYMGRSGSPRFGQNAVGPSERLRSESVSSSERSPSGKHRVPAMEVCHMMSMKRRFSRGYTNDSFACSSDAIFRQHAKKVPCVATVVCILSRKIEHTEFLAFFCLRFFQLSHHLYQGGYTYDFRRALATRQFKNNSLSSVIVRVSVLLRRNVGDGD